MTTTRARVTSVVSAILTAALLTTACQAVADDPSATDSTTGPGASASSTSTPMPEFEVYVSLGDSYTAAPLFHAEDNPTGCLRSKDNYPNLLADELDLDLTDVSCSGARTDHMLKPQRFALNGKPRPPQFDAISEETDLVTVGIGANDFRFFGRMIVDCAEIGRKQRTGSPCQKENSLAPVPERIENKLDTITRSVRKVVRGAARRAPNARIFLIGYPQLLPNIGTCRDRLPLAKGDWAFVRRLNLSLADAVREGALLGGAEFVDLVEASQGHDICSDDPWIAGVRGPQREALGLHPYREEQRAVAALIAELLASEPAN